MRKYHIANIKSGYDAASRSPESMRHFKNADPLAADAALNPSVRKTIIHRARYEVFNNGYADGIINTLAEDTIGTGPRLQLTPKVPTADNTFLQGREERFAAWASAVKLTKILKIARMTKARDGEVFIRIVQNSKIRSHAKFSVMLYESEQVGSSIISDVATYHENGVPKEYDGIIFDEEGNPEFYRFWKVHPGAHGISFSTEDSFTIPADRVLHYANFVRPGQHRGVSEIASTLNIFNDFRRFSNAVLSAAETAAEISFVLSTKNPSDDGSEYENSENNGSPIKFMDVVELVRNAGLALPDGYEISQLKAEQPTDKYVDYIDAKISECARPLSMPFAIAKGDCSKSNYASGRLDHQAYHKKIYGERQDIIDVILDPLLREFEDFDQIAFPEAYQIPVRHSWMWDGFEHVDPVKEANAQAIRLQNNTTTLAEECAREGKDFETTIHQIAYENELKKKLGINNTSVTGKEFSEDEE